MASPKLVYQKTLLQIKSEAETLLNEPAKHRKTSRVFDPRPGENSNLKRKSESYQIACPRKPHQLSSERTQPNEEACHQVE